MWSMPILVPIAQGFGIDPIHFGVVVVSDDLDPGPAEKFEENSETVGLRSLV